MTTLCTSPACAGDPADGLGYHAFDCPEVAPKERPMTTNERPLGELERTAERWYRGLRGLQRVSLTPLQAFSAGYEAASSDLQALQEAVGELARDVGYAVTAARADLCRIGLEKIHARLRALLPVPEVEEGE